MSIVACPAPAEPPFEQHPRSATIDSASLFRMGFDPQAVGTALVATEGDPAGALRLLSSPLSADSAESSGPTPTTLSPPSADDAPEDDDATQLALAIQMSLEQPWSRNNKCRESSDSSVNPLWAPSRYVPPSESAGAKLLSLVENVEVRDGGYAWQGGRAFLDTGNQHMTIIDARFAARHSIYRDSPPAALAGLGGGFGQAERWTTIRGVVPGVSSRAPCVTVALKIRDHDFLVQCAVSDLGTHDLLVGVDVLDRLFAAGYRIGQGSMG